MYFNWVCVEVDLFTSKQVNLYQLVPIRTYWYLKGLLATNDDLFVPWIWTQKVTNKTCKLWGQILFKWLIDPTWLSSIFCKTLNGLREYRNRPLNGTKYILLISSCFNTLPTGPQKLNGVVARDTWWV